MKNSKVSLCMENVGDPILWYESDKSGRYLCKTINANREQAVLARESSTMDIHDNNHIDYEKAVKRFLDVHFRGLRCRGEDESCKRRLVLLAVFTDTNEQCTTTIAITVIPKSEVNLILLDIKNAVADRPLNSPLPDFTVTRLECEQLASIIFVNALLRITPHSVT